MNIHTYYKMCAACVQLLQEITTTCVCVAFFSCFIDFFLSFTCFKRNTTMQSSEISNLLKLSLNIYIRNDAEHGMVKSQRLFIQHIVPVSLILVFFSCMQRFGQNYCARRTRQRLRFWQISKIMEIQYIKKQHIVENIHTENEFQ